MTSLSIRGLNRVTTSKHHASNKGERDGQLKLLKNPTPCKIRTSNDQGMKSFLKKSPTIILVLSASAISLQAQQFYFNANCVSQIELEEQCNVSFMRKSMSARFDTGRATKVKYSNIRAWNYTDSTKLKMDTELAARIGIIGLLFKKAVHRHVFSLNYRDDFGDKQNLIVNFSDSQYVNPMLAALRRKNAAEEIK